MDRGIVDSRETRIEEAEVTGGAVVLIADEDDSQQRVGAQKARVDDGGSFLLEGSPGGL